MKFDWVETAIREEADWMVRGGFTIPSTNICQAWQALARRTPTVPRDMLDGEWIDWHLSRGDRVEGREPDDAWSDKEVAFRVTFCEAVCLPGRVRAFTVSEIRSQAEAHHEQAVRLRKEADRLQRSLIGGRPYAKALREAAFEYEGAADMVRLEALKSPPGLLVRRHQGDPLVRGYCVFFVEAYARDIRR
jgi:hypothetical protein